MIGPNGAGKSTFVNVVSGIYAPESGKILFQGEDITGGPAHEIAARGIGRTFQLTPLFADFTVLENVSASFYLHPHSSLVSAYLNTPSYRKNEVYVREQSLEILKLVGLEKVKDEPARNQPHGYQKMLGVARALATRPALLLLDEPLGGMNPSEIEASLDAIREMRARGMTILVVEHNMQILDLCDWVVVISFGRKICEGIPQDIRESEAVVSAYFGGECFA